MNRHKALGDRSVTFRHIVLGDRSVTFRHQDNMMRIGVSRTDTRGIKIMNLEIMLINSSEKNLFPKWYDMEAWVLMSVLDVIYQRFVFMLLLQIEYCSWFMIWSDIYCFLFWVCRWYLLSTCVLYWPLLVCFFLCYLWSTANVPSSSTQPQL